MYDYIIRKRLLMISILFYVFSNYNVVIMHFTTFIRSKK